MALWKIWYKGYQYITIEAPSEGDAEVEFYKRSDSDSLEDNMVQHEIVDVKKVGV